MACYLKYIKMAAFKTAGEMAQQKRRNKGTLRKNKKLGENLM
jgi:hypothetical protein